MAKHIEHKNLRPGCEIYDVTVVTKTNDGWRRASGRPWPPEADGRMTVWFVDGGAATRGPGYRWLTR